MRKLMSAAALAALSTSMALAGVDVNKATEAELDSVKGIGPATTRLIVQERRKAPFTSWDDFIRRVEGLAGGRATRLSDGGLTVGGQPYAPAPPKAPPRK